MNYKMKKIRTDKVFDIIFQIIIIGIICLFGYGITYLINLI